MEKHGRNDIWLQCGHWADGREVGRGEGTQRRLSAERWNPGSPPGQVLLQGTAGWGHVL